MKINLELYGFNSWNRKQALLFDACTFVHWYVMFRLEDVYGPFSPLCSPDNSTVRASVYHAV